jgi:pantoate--beta-alanine ligase
VNPAQFGPKEDFGKYPRTLQADLKLLGSAGDLAVLAPSVEEMYPRGAAASVEVEGDLTRLWEGKSRPGHFKGVATVVAKLFAVVAPDRAYFGSKDYQQVAVVRRMTAALLMPVEIVACPTFREKDGLAMSSRNRYLSPAERRQAPRLYQALQAAARAVKSGEPDPALVRQAGLKALAGSGFKVDYFAVASPLTLEPMKKVTGSVWLAVAARLGTTRLIDNLVVKA